MEYCLTQGLAIQVLLALPSTHPDYHYYTMATHSSSTRVFQSRVGHAMQAVCVSPKATAVSLFIAVDGRDRRCRLCSRTLNRAQIKRVVQRAVRVGAIATLRLCGGMNGVDEGEVWPRCGKNMMVLAEGLVIVKCCRLSFEYTNAHFSMLRGFCMGTKKMLD